MRVLICLLWLASVLAEIVQIADGNFSSIVQADQEWLLLLYKSKSWIISLMAGIDMQTGVDSVSSSKSSTENWTGDSRPNP